MRLTNGTVPTAVITGQLRTIAHGSGGRAMINLHKAGGVAALVAALAYVVGFVVLATLLNPGSVEGWSAAQKLGFVLERETFFKLWLLFIYVAVGGLLVVLSVALHERLKERALPLMQIATAFALIWAGLVIASGMVAIVGLDAAGALYDKDVAQATSLWIATSAVQNGLGGGIEIVGGVWVLLISWVALRTGGLPRALNALGLIVGAAGIVSALPGLDDLSAVFGLGQIPWFAWIGIALLRRAEHLPSV